MKFARAQLSLRSMSQVAVAVALAVGGVLFGGCSSYTLSGGRSIDTIVAFAPAPTLVEKGQELRAADEAAAHTAGAQAFIGAGESMQPVYASGTAIVATPIDFTQLRPGMSVVYVNASGRGVAHALVESTREGWVVQGVNNPEPDADLVTASNLVGVVTQAYASSDTAVRQQIAARSSLRLARVAGGGEQVTVNLSKSGTGNTVQAWQ